jgi:hypothetical protein
MGSAKLADRLRGILKAPGYRTGTVSPVDVSADPAGRGVDARPSSLDAARYPAGQSSVDIGGTTVANGADVEHVLGGRWVRGDGPTCFVVERRYEPEAIYGAQSVTSISAGLLSGAGDASLVAGGARVRPPFLFFDLETTGLGGGAGTYAFLVGCGRFDDAGGFLTRQFVLMRPADERPLLQMFAIELARAGTLVSFNGKSFDAPLIETRHSFHRLEWTGGSLPHLDVLHPARRFWSDGGPLAPACSLGVLETQVLGARRIGDVAGFEIPNRYFHFLRTGDAEPLVAVLEHNRLDLLSLAGLTSRLCDLVRLGPDAARHAKECLGLGRVYARGGLEGRAREAYERAMRMGSLSEDGVVEALRSLALLSRRARRYDHAAACWTALLEMPAPPAHVAREASAALAIHHEHRARDLHAARAFALRSLGKGDDARAAGWNATVRHRLARIAKKMGVSEQPALFPSSPLPPSSGSQMSARRTSS